MSPVNLSIESLWSMITLALRLITPNELCSCLLKVSMHGQIGCCYVARTPLTEEFYRIHPNSVVSQLIKFTLL